MFKTTNVLVHSTYFFVASSNTIIQPTNTDTAISIISQAAVVAVTQAGEREVVIEF